MLKYLDDLIDIHYGKTGYVLGLGPSLNVNMEHVLGLNHEENCIISCNNVDIMTNIKPHYWIVANPSPEFSVYNNSQRFNKLTGTCLLFCYRCDNCNYKKIKPHIYDDERRIVDERQLSIDFVPFYDTVKNKKEHILKSINGVARRTLHEVYCDYVSGNLMAPVNAKIEVETVAIHMLKLAIISGCNPIYITGVDLDYNKGYVNLNNDKNIQKRKNLGLRIMQGNTRNNTLKYFHIINEEAKNNGIKIYSTIENGYINSVFEFKKLQ